VDFEKKKSQPSQYYISRLSRGGLYFTMTTGGQKSPWGTNVGGWGVHALMYVLIETKDWKDQ